MLNNKSLLLAAGGKFYTPFVKTHEITVGVSPYDPTAFGFINYEFYPEENYGSISTKELTISDVFDSYTALISAFFFSAGDLSFGLEEDSAVPANNFFLYLIVNKDNTPIGIYAEVDLTLMSIERTPLTEFLWLESDIGKSYEVYISQTPPTFKWLDIRQ